MITLNRTRLRTARNATLNDCLVLSGVSDSICTNTVSPVFTNCTENFTTTLDKEWLTTSNEINELGQIALNGAGVGGVNLIEWSYSQTIDNQVSIFSVWNTGTPNGTYMTKFYDDVRDEIIQTKSFTFTDGNASTTLPVPEGSSVHSLYKSADSISQGICCVGVTK